MKNLHIFLIALCVLMMLGIFSSCEKLSLPEDNGSETPKGNLRVTVTEIEKIPFPSLIQYAQEASSRAMVPVSTVCERLNFVVYDMNGTRVKQVNQTLDAADYGTASFQLPEGDYMVVVVGHSSNGNPTMTNPYKIQFTNSQGFTDTFLYYGEVTIGEEGVDLQVSLDRIVALCRFVITDDFPSDVKKMRFYYTGGSGAFDATTGLGCVNSKQDVKFDVVAGQNEFELYTFLHDVDGTIHLTVTALDATGNELYNRTFDVPMEQNQITKHAGAFFNGSGSSSTTISDVMVNADWAGEKLITF